MVSPTAVERFDFQRIDSARVTKTSQGFLRVSGNLTRVGVLPYYRADGSVYRELRHPDEVFRTDSLASMVGAPVTELHKGMVNPGNVQSFSIGFVGENVDHTEKFVTGSATIQRADAIEAVQSKKLCELSPGYKCWLEDAPGDWYGQHYDGVQRDIVYNHLAIGPKNWGRSGPDVALRMDGLSAAAAFAKMDNHGMGTFLRDRFSLLQMTEAELASKLGVELVEFGMLLDGFITPSASQLSTISELTGVPMERLEGLIPESEKGTKFVSKKRDGGDPAPPPRGHVPMKKIQIKIDGVAYTVDIPEALADNFESAFQSLQTKADSVSGLEAKVVVAEKATRDVQGKLDAANDPETIQAAIAARAALVASVSKVAPDLKVDEKLDSRGLQVAALVSAGFAQETFEKRDGAFVEGVFTGALANAKTPAVAAIRSGGAHPPVVKTDQKDAEHDKYDSNAARERMIERNRNVPFDRTWKTA